MSTRLSKPKLRKYSTINIHKYSSFANHVDFSAIGHETLYSYFCASARERELLLEVAAR